MTNEILVLGWYWTSESNCKLNENGWRLQQSPVVFRSTYLDAAAARKIRVVAIWINFEMPLNLITCFKHEWFFYPRTAGTIFSRIFSHTIHLFSFINSMSKVKSPLSVAFKAAMYVDLRFLGSSVNEALQLVMGHLYRLYPININ